MKELTAEQLSKIREALSNVVEDLTSHKAPSEAVQRQVKQVSDEMLKYVVADFADNPQAGVDYNHLRAQAAMLTAIVGAEIANERKERLVSDIFVAAKMAVQLLKVLL